MNRIDIFKKELESILVQNGVQIEENKDQEILSSFKVNGLNVLITKHGKIVFSDNASQNQMMLAKKYIAEAQNRANIVDSLAIKNLDEDKLDTFFYNKTKYYMVMQWKNVIIGYKYYGILGYTYVVCLKTNIEEQGIYYVDFNEYDTFNEALKKFNSKAEIRYETIVSPFEKKELESLVYTLNNIDIDNKPKEQVNDLCSVVNKCLILLKMYKSEK